MNKTKIDWTDFTWNPVTGCKNTCDYCYARAISKRFKRSFEPELHEDRLEDPYKLKEPSKIFVCSMADLFGDWVPDEWIKKILKVVKDNPQHIFQFLTKNPDRYNERFNFPDNVWFGATVTNQEEYEKAIQKLRTKRPPKLNFISFEPLLNEINPYNCGWEWFNDVGPKVFGIDWIIIGACTHPKPFQPERKWVKRIVDFADEFEIPVVLKSNLNYFEQRKEFPKREGS